MRLSEDEYYVFSPFVANARGISGTCIGELAFDQVDGSALGAELAVVSDAQVYSSAAAVVGRSLYNVSNGELANPQHFQLSTPDGRIIDLTVKEGLLWASDSNGNTVTVNRGYISHSEGKTFFFSRDAKNRITQVRTNGGTLIKYTYDSAGDLRAHTSAEGFRTNFEYATSPAHYLSKVTNPQGVEQALFAYDDQGRLRQSCGAENHCVEQVNDIVGRSAWFIDGEEELRSTYDERGNVLTQANALNETWTYTYDARNRMLTSRNPLNEDVYL